MSDITQTQQSTKSDYFNLTIKGLGYLSHIRQVNGQHGNFISCVINALTGPTDNPHYTRFDITVAGKETTDLIRRCQKAVEEDKKVLLGFTLSNLSTDIFTLSKGDHAGEQRVSLRARLIKIDWIKVGQDKVYSSHPETHPYGASASPCSKSFPTILFQAEKSDSTPPSSENTPQAYASNSF